jgi:hypothetical protein
MRVELDPFGFGRLDPHDPLHAAYDAAGAVFVGVESVAGLAGGTWAGVRWWLALRPTSSVSALDGTAKAAGDRIVIGCW